MSVFHRGTHEMEMVREEHGHTGESDQGVPGKKTIEVGGLVATKVVISGDITYVAKAVIGSDQSDPVWQAKKIDQTSGVIITWADGNANFDNVATDLSALTYT